MPAIPSEAPETDSVFSVSLQGFILSLCILNGWQGSYASRAFNTGVRSCLSYESLFGTWAKFLRA